MYKNKKAFTLVELIVVITILAILGTIAFISLQGYSKQARDSRRVSDISNIKTALELFILNTGYYPKPDVVGSGAVYYSGDLLWTQGTVGNNVSTNLSRNLPNKPLDPLFDIEYTYSLASSNKEYQVMTIYEGELSKINLINSSYAANTYNVKVEGTFNELFIKTPNYIVPVPSLITSEETPFDLEVDAEKIESMIITNGTNFPSLNIPNTTVETGGLIINLSPYTGTITSKSGTGAMIAAINAIQGAYTGTTLATNDIYQNILSKTTDEEKINFTNTVVINNINAVASIVTNSCATNPIFANLGALNTGTPTSANQTWTYSVTPGNCTYVCTGGYSGDDCLIAPDPNGNDEYTVLLLHGDGTGDASASSHTVTPVNNPQELAGGKFDGAWYFNGSSYLSILQNPDFDWGIDDFTIDGFFKRTSLGTIKYIFGTCGTDGNEDLSIRIESNNTMQILLRDSTNTLNFASTTLAITDTSNWHHIAFVKSGNTVKLALDGVFDNTNFINFTGKTAYYSPDVFAIGNLGSYAGGLFFPGYIDEFRISKGIARWTTNFNTELPTAPYGN